MNAEVTVEGLLDEAMRSFDRAVTLARHRSDAIETAHLQEAREFAHAAATSVRSTRARAKARRAA
ncbi:hypothetical protein [uncultured Arsenicicoccus sp.]|mgnify:CR=1 FL=1|uniref:hypothetical protein n=1 Tax=uncultured Arsenicicoccus sp. TaxID=491339 RepID=UPI002595A830|nr:hypothetical protein [uncultured Arsenicicoccus sp.]